MPIFAGVDGDIVSVDGIAENTVFFDCCGQERPFERVVTRISLVEPERISEYYARNFCAAVAEEVRKVHAICVRCGNLANHSHRLSNSMELVVLGEKDAYEPLCRDCYNKVMAEEAARSNL